MILFLINNWKSLLAMLATGVLAYGLHSLDVNRLEAKARAEVAAVTDAINAQCKADKAITTEVSNDYQKQLNGLNSELIAMRLQPSTCVAVQPTSTSTGHNASSAGKSVHKDGITTRALYDYAGEAEKYRLQLVGCQDFIRRTWAEKRQ